MQTSGNLSPRFACGPSMTMRFHIAEDVRALGVRGAFAALTGLDNTLDDAALAPWRAELLDRLRSKWSPERLAVDPVLAGFRHLHDRVGRSNRRFPASAEALAALFLRKGIVPVINPLVDLYNGVSLETGLSLGAHDLARVQGNVTLRFTTGGERFVPLGAEDPDAIGAGEYAYFDDTGEILCRLEHRQCERTRVTRDTTGCFYIVQGNPATDRNLIEAALDRLIDVTRQHCGGEVAARWIVD